jgi:hypothetical protein
MAFSTGMQGSNLSALQGIAVTKQPSVTLKKEG